MSGARAWLLAGVSAAVAAVVASGITMVTLQDDEGAARSLTEAVAPETIASSLEAGGLPEELEQRESPAVPSLAVSVAGAVRLPGMYRLEAGDRVHHLLERAGGILERADLRDINLAAHLLDGTTLHVPALPVVERSAHALVLKRGNAGATTNPAAYTRNGWRPVRAEVSTPPARSPQLSPPPADGLLDLNAASQVQLEALPGIGPVTAAKILAYRESNRFQSVTELQNVSGIGPKRLEAIQHLVTVR